jgi:hypothetical protein
MALNVTNIVKLEKVVEPVKESEPPPVPTSRRQQRKDDRGFTVVKSALKVGNLIVGNSKVDPAEQVVKQLKQQIDGKEKLKMSYFLVPRESDYLSHNTKGNRR